MPLSISDVAIDNIIAPRLYENAIRTKPLHRTKGRGDFRGFFAVGKFDIPKITQRKHLQEKDKNGTLSLMYQSQRT